MITLFRVILFRFFAFYTILISPFSFKYTYNDYDLVITMGKKRKTPEEIPTLDGGSHAELYELLTEERSLKSQLVLVVARERVIRGETHGYGL